MFWLVAETCFVFGMLVQLSGQLSVRLCCSLREHCVSINQARCLEKGLEIDFSKCETHQQKYHNLRFWLRMNSLAIPCVLVSLLAACVHASNPTILHEWVTVEYEWTDAERAAAIASGAFVPHNNIITGEVLGGFPIALPPSCLAFH